MDRNNIYRGSLLNYDINTILNMLHGYIQNDLFIGDYICICGINFRIAKFNGNKNMILFPDTCLCYAPMTLERNIYIDSFEDSYIYKQILPQIYEKYIKYLPIINISLLSCNDINNLPLMKMNQDIISSPRRYWLRDKAPFTIESTYYKFKSVASLGKIGVSRQYSTRGVRPIITVGYTAYRV